MISYKIMGEEVDAETSFAQLAAHSDYLEWLDSDLTKKFISILDDYVLELLQNTPDKEGYDHWSGQKDGLMKLLYWFKESKEFLKEDHIESE